MTPRLITIPFSHYCEKARWALDRAGVAYVEQGHLPGLHMPHTRRAGGRTVPMLVLADRALRDSADIVVYADGVAGPSRKLYPASAAARSEVDRIEALCNDRLGKATRLLAYHYTLGRPRSLLEIVRPGLTGLQTFAFPFLVPLVRPLIRKRYRVTEERAKVALETVRQGFAEVSAQLGSKRWLVGDGLTAADVTFASLAAPVLAPEGHPKLTGGLGAADGPFRAILEEMRSTPAGAHALRLYREERDAKIA